MSGDNGLLSICCLGYNHADFILDNIKAVWNSDYKNIEIIVVDDGSKDDSAKILKDLQKLSPFPMTVVLQENTGNIGHNLNVALKHAKGQFVAFISLDDILCSDKIKKCITKLSENPSLAFIASSEVYAIDRNGNKIHTVPESKLNTLENVTIDDLLDLEYNEFGAFYIQGAFFRKKIIDIIGGFDEDMTGDDIVLRTKLFRYIKSNPEYVYDIIREHTCCYRRHGENVSKNIRRQIKIVTEYLGRYWPDKKNPEILVSWALYAISVLSFKDVLSLFSMNARATSLLNNDLIQNKLFKKVKSKILFKFFNILSIYKTKTETERKIIFEVCDHKLFELKFNRKLKK